MKFDLQELNPGTFFDFGEDGGRISLRLCAGDDLRDIQKATVKKRVEFKNGQRYEVEDVNEALRGEMLWDFSIVNWEKFFDAQGKEIPCTRENKILLMGKSPRFANFVASCLQELRDKQEAEVLAQRKN